MAKLDFPSSPTFGMRYPDPAVPGIPVYTWDLEKWVASGPVGSPPQAPFDAMAYSGMQINGGMEVSQELGDTAVSVTSTAYIVDGWKGYTAGPSVISGYRSGTCPLGYTASLTAAISSADAAPAAGSYCFLRQVIEGYRIVRLAWGTANTQPITLAFWVHAVRPGTYSGSVTNDLTHSYVFTFTVNAASTWEYKIITIPGATDGIWGLTNGIGITLSFAIMCGTTYQATPGTWLASSAPLGATGTVNGAAATTDVFRITGVTVLPGTQAPTAAQSPNIMRPYDQELVTCQRYWQRVRGSDQSWTTSNSESHMYKIPIHPTMRTTPTTINEGAGAYNNLYSVVAYSVDQYGVNVQPTYSAAGTNSYDIDRSIILDARL